MNKTESHVTLDSDVLKNFSVYSALVFARALDLYDTKADHDEIVQEATDKGYFTIRATIKNDLHHFGPSLHLSGGKTDIEVVIPWHQIRSIVHSPSGDLSALGFKPGSD